MSDRTPSIISSFWLLFGLIVTGFTLYYFRGIVLLAFLAFILASAIRPLVKLGKRVHIPAALTIFSSYIMLFVLISLLFATIIPPLVEQSAQLVSAASHSLGLNGQLSFLSEFRLDLTQWESYIEHYDQYSGILNQITGSLQTALQIVFSTFSVLFISFTLLVITFHMLLDLDDVALSFAWLLPKGSGEDRAKQALKIMDDVTIKLGSWVRGQALLMLVIGVITYIGLRLLGVPYALPLAIFAGLLEFIPNLGPTIAAVPAVVAAFLLVNPWIGLATIGFYILVQNLENTFIVPSIMKEAVDVKPLATILLLLIGFEFMGVAGALFSVPLYLVIRSTIQELWPNQGPFADHRKFLKK